MKAARALHSAVTRFLTLQRASASASAIAASGPAFERLGLHVQEAAPVRRWLLCSAGVAAGGLTVLTGASCFPTTCTGQVSTSASAGTDSELPLELPRLFVVADSISMAWGPYLEKASTLASSCFHVYREACLPSSLSGDLVAPQYLLPLPHTTVHCADTSR